MSQRVDRQGKPYTFFNDPAKDELRSKLKLVALFVAMTVLVISVEVALHALGISHFQSHLI